MELQKPEEPHPHPNPLLRRRGDKKNLQTETTLYKRLLFTHRKTGRTFNFYHAVATNYEEEEKDAYSILKWHNERGTAENFNKELKIGFGMERMPCGSFSANAVFFRLGVISYNLFIGFKRLSCPEGWLRHTIATFRWKLIQTAGRIISHAGSTILKLAAGVKKLELFREIRRKTYETSLSLA